jgi:hypothetical protein
MSYLFLPRFQILAWIYIPIIGCGFLHREMFKKSKGGPGGRLTCVVDECPEQQCNSGCDGRGSAPKNPIKSEEMVPFLPHVTYSEEFVLYISIYCKTHQRLLSPWIAGK